MISYNLTSLGIIPRATWVRRESLLKNFSSRVSWPCLVCQDLESDDAEYVRKSVTGHETREVCECSPYAWYTLLTTPKSGLTTSTLHSPRFTFMRWRSRFNGVPAGRRLPHHNWFSVSTQNQNFTVAFESSPLCLSRAPVTYDNSESPCKIYTVFDNCPPQRFFTRDVANG